MLWYLCRSFSLPSPAASPRRAQFRTERQLSPAAVEAKRREEAAEISGQVDLAVELGSAKSDGSPRSIACESLVGELGGDGTHAERV